MSPIKLTSEGLGRLLLPKAAPAAGSWAGPAWFWLGGGARVVGGVGSTPQVDSTRASAESTPLEWSLEKSTLLSTTKFKIISSGVKLFTFNQKNNYLYINNCSSKLSFNKFLESLEELRKNSKNSSFYKLSKYQRSNQDTCINQKPVVQKGECFVSMTTWRLL